MGKEEVECILSKIDRSKTLFEWGSGMSTIFFSQYCRLLHTVEHDKKWVDITYNLLKERNIENVNLSLIHI